MHVLGNDEINEAPSGPEDHILPERYFLHFESAANGSKEALSCKDDTSRAGLPSINPDIITKTLLGDDRIPTALVSTNCEIIWYSQDTLRILRQKGFVDPVTGRLVVPFDEWASRFEAFVRTGEDGKRLLVRSDSTREWTVIRLRCCQFAGRPARLLRFAFSAAEIDCARNGMTELFPLTPTEIAVLNRYVRLCSPEDVARDMNISRETVRCHLKRIRAKTGVNGGRELIRLVTSFDQS